MSLSRRIGVFAGIVVLVCVAVAAFIAGQIRGAGSAKAEPNGTGNDTADVSPAAAKPLRPKLNPTEQEARGAPWTVVPASDALQAKH